jgi:hypothetical protein
MARRFSGPSEVLVSSTVKDLLVGSGIEFDDRGTQELRGVPGQWHLYAARKLIRPDRPTSRLLAGYSNRDDAERDGKRASLFMAGVRRPIRGLLASSVLATVRPLSSPESSGCASFGARREFGNG